MKPTGAFMSLSFQHHHGAMLLKYSGISFISGAVNHGFFSGERSLWTALIGMVLFVLGAILEHRLTDDPEERPSNLLHALLLGALLSIGLGFFTGGLQHFPDSPARSAWVVPMGFFVSVLALALNGSANWQRSSWVYTLMVGVAVSLGCYVAWQWLDRHPQFASSGHDHAASSTEADHASHGAVTSLNAMTVDRVVEIRMSDDMRFSPNTLNIQTGETIRFLVHNDGKTLHEMVLGSEAEILDHAKSMQSDAHHAHSHAGGVAVQVAPGGSKELIVQFTQPGSIQMACLVPGHYEAGMRGSINVHNQTSPPSTQSAVPSRKDGHAGHSH